MRKRSALQGRRGRRGKSTNTGAPKTRDLRAWSPRRSGAASRARPAAATFARRADGDIPVRIEQPTAGTLGERARAVTPPISGDGRRTSRAVVVAPARSSTATPQRSSPSPIDSSPVRESSPGCLPAGLASARAAKRFREADELASLESERSTKGVEGSLPVHPYAAKLLITAGSDADVGGASRGDLPVAAWSLVDAGRVRLPRRRRARARCRARLEASRF